MTEPTTPEPPEAAETPPVATTRDFDRIFRANVDKLCRFLYGYVGSIEIAQDLVGDVFFKLWRRLEDAERGAGVEPIRDVDGYLYRSARHHAIDFLRRRELEERIQRERAADAELAPISPIAHPERDFAELDLIATLQRAVDQLPPRQREITLLKWQRQASTDEIAERLGISAATVTEHFRRALARLRELLPHLREDR
jgi:RNA polymerase sigma-70 factor (ECF subfamily)